MKNKFKLIYITIIVFSFYISPIYSIDQFNFDVTEIEIIDEGNKFIGKKEELLQQITMLK